MNVFKIIVSALLISEDVFPQVKVVLMLMKFNETRRRDISSSFAAIMLVAYGFVSFKKPPWADRRESCAQGQIV